MFKLDVDNLKKIQSELNELIENIEYMNNKSEIMGQKIIDAGVPEEYLSKISEIIMQEFYE